MIGDAAILAGGRATRLGALAAHTPKSLITVDGRPFIKHQLDLLHGWGIKRAVLCIGHHGFAIRRVIGEGSVNGIEIVYSEDGRRPMGTAGALALAAPLLPEQFCILYGDAYLDLDFHAAAAAFHASGQLALMTVYRNDDDFAPSNVYCDDNQVVAYDKLSQDPRMKHIDFGLSFLDRRVLRDVSRHSPTDLSTCFQRLAATSQLAAYEVPNRFYEIGTLQGLAETQAHLRGKRGE